MGSCKDRHKTRAGDRAQLEIRTYRLVRNRVVAGYPRLTCGIKNTSFPSYSIESPVEHFEMPEPCLLRWEPVQWSREMQLRCDTNDDPVEFPRWDTRLPSVSNSPLNGPADMR